MKKPVTPQIHGIIDYAFSGILCAAPSAMGLNKFSTRTYAAIGTNFLAVNSLTDTPVAVKKVFSMKSHQKADLLTLGTLGLLTFAKPIRNDSKALGFHLGFLALAVTHYMLTDYNASEK